jgi:sugar phosphate isomerase/epimerase
MKISLSCRITEQSDNKEKSFYPINSFIKLAANQGFQGISLRPSVISSQSKIEDINQIKKLFDLYNINISMITSNINLAKNNEYASDNLKNISSCLNLADILGTSLVRIMIKNNEDIIYAQKALDEASERGIILTQQTHWGTLAETVEDTLFLIKKINRDNFAITFEPANLMACGGKYNVDALKTLLPYIVNFYFQNIILDHNGKHVFKTYRNGNIKVSYVPLDDHRGIPIDPLLILLKEMNYKGWVTVHQPLLDRQDIDEAIKEAANVFMPYRV